MNVERQNINREKTVDEQLRRKAEAIALFVGGDYNMTVSLGDYGSGWSWDFVKNHVNMDPKDLIEEPEDIVKGIAAHEGNHRLASRAEHVQDLWKEPGFSFGFNAVEDPRANQSGIFFRPGEKEWIRAYIERDLSEGGGLDYKSISREVEESLGYVPKHMKWGAEVIRYWYEKEFNNRFNDDSEKVNKFLDEIPEKDVRTLVADTLDSFDKYYQTIPKVKEEMEIQRKARDSSGTFKSEIWPKYKRLVENSYKDQSIVEMIKDMMSRDGHGNQQIETGEQSLDVPFNLFPDDVKDEIKKKVGEQNNKGKNKQKKEVGIMQEGEKGTGSLEEKDKQKASRKTDDSKDMKTDEEEMGESSSGSKIPWDKLSDRAKEESEKIFNELPEDFKEELRDRAKKTLEESEDNANEKLRGKMNDQKYLETNKEKQERENREAMQRDLKKDSEQMIQDMIRRNNEAIKKIPSSHYMDVKVSPEVALIIRTQDREYKRIFVDDENPYVRHAYSGTIPSMKRAMEFESDPRKSNIFESKGRPLTKSHRFFILVDCSQSMDGMKIDETFKNLVIISELFTKHKIEYEIAGFSCSFSSSEGNIKVYKNFDTKRLNLETQEKISEIIDDCSDGTPLTEATAKGYKILKERIMKRPMQHNYFITLTDGEGNNMDSFNQVLNKIRKDNEVLTTGFGIGPATDFVNKVYPKLPEIVKKDISRKLNKNEAEIGNSYKDFFDFSKAFVIIMGYMVRYPDLFKR